MSSPNSSGTVDGVSMALSFRQTTILPHSPDYEKALWVRVMRYTAHAAAS